MGVPTLVVTGILLFDRHRGYQNCWQKKKDECSIRETTLLLNDDKWVGTWMCGWVWVCICYYCLLLHCFLVNGGIFSGALSSGSQWVWSVDVEGLGVNIMCLSVEISSTFDSHKTGGKTRVRPGCMVLSQRIPHWSLCERWWHQVLVCWENICVEILTHSLPNNTLQIQSWLSALAYAHFVYSYRWRVHGIHSEIWRACWSKKTGGSEKTWGQGRKETTFGRSGWSDMGVYREKQEPQCPSVARTLCVL